MKTFVLSLLLIFLCAIVTAQNKYFNYTYNGLNGLTDKDAVDIIPATYRFRFNVPNKNLAVFIPDHSEEQTLTFNTVTGEKKMYESFSTQQIKINGETFSQVVENNSKYLWSESSDKKINIPHVFNQCINVGTKYIIVSYFFDDKPDFKIIKLSADRGRPTIKTKKISIEMPAIDIDHYAVLENNDTLKILFQGDFNSCQPLFASHTFTSSLSNTSDSLEFKGLLCSLNGMHSVYDSSLHLIKKFQQVVKFPTYFEPTFIADNPGLIKILNTCSKILKSTLRFAPSRSIIEFAVPVGSAEIDFKSAKAPEMEEIGEVPISIKQSIDSTSVVENIPEKSEVKERIPTLSLEKNGVLNIVSIIDEYYNYKKLFATEYVTHLNYDGTISLENDKKYSFNTIDFEVDLKRKKVLLPEKYIKLLNMIIY